MFPSSTAPPTSRRSSRCVGTDDDRRGSRAWVAGRSAIVRVCARRGADRGRPTPGMSRPPTSRSMTVTVPVDRWHRPERELVAQRRLDRVGARRRPARSASTSSRSPTASTSPPWPSSVSWSLEEFVALEAASKATGCVYDGVVATRRHGAPARRARSGMSPPSPRPATSGPSSCTCVHPRRMESPREHTIERVIDHAVSVSLAPPLASLEEDGLMFGIDDIVGAFTVVEVAAAAHR